MFVSLAAHAVGPVYRASDGGGRAPAAPAGPDATPLKWRVARHSLLEFVMAVVLLFGVTGIVRWVAGPSPVSSDIPELRLQLLVIGAAVGVLLSALILSPAGKASGGHLNPAISLSMWRLGAFPGVAVVPYIVAQLAGSLLGALVGRAVWGDVIDDPPVFDAALQPGQGWTSLDLFPAEAASMAVIVMIVAWFLSVRLDGRPDRSGRPSRRGAPSPHSLQRRTRGVGLHPGRTLISGPQRDVHRPGPTGRVEVRVVGLAAALEAGLLDRGRLVVGHPLRVGERREAERPHRTGLPLHPFRAPAAATWVADASRIDEVLARRP